MTANTTLSAATNNVDFEAALNELETVVGELDGDVKLERALELFDRGMKLSLHCESFLKAAEQKVEILKRAANGTVTVESFEAPNNAPESSSANEP